MTIGTRIRQARQELGLSQRELAGEDMTRNLLSALEHDRAKPSLDTLMVLSQKLHRPVGYFLEEDEPEEQRDNALNRAREAFDRGAWAECRTCLEGISGEENGERERTLLLALTLKHQAKEAWQAGRLPYARTLLEQAEEAGKNHPYLEEGFFRELSLLRGNLAQTPEERAKALRALDGDEILLLRGKVAVEAQDWDNALRYLQGMDHRQGQWYWLMGQTLCALGHYAQAAEAFHQVEDTMGQPVWKQLQVCYAALGDYEKAYRYAIRT